MKKSSIIFLLAMICQVVFAQNKQEITFQPFSKVNLQGIMDVEVKLGEVNKVNVEAINGANLDDLTVALNGGELSIKTKIWNQLTDKDNNRRNGNWQKKYKIEIIYNSTLYGVSAGRGANVNFNDVLKSNHLKVEASAGAILALEVNTNSLELSSVQGAEVKISGIANFQTTRVNTGGELRASDLESEEAEIKANTGGEARIKVTKYINASAGTGGSIHYSGMPSQRNVHTSLGGEVQSN